MREGKVERKTKETAVAVRLALDGTGEYKLDMGMPFLEHMLAQLTFHGGLDLEGKGEGDLEVDAHHLVEDVGICLGQALLDALGEKRGIRRFGWAVVPMDEALVMTAIDISERPYLAFDVDFPQPRVGTFETRLLREFFRALANHAAITVHIRKFSGDESHHLAEACFKSFGQALRQAVGLREGEEAVPSKKGII